MVPPHERHARLLADLEETLSSDLVHVIWALRPGPETDILMGKLAERIGRSMRVVRLAGTAAGTGDLAERILQRLGDSNPERDPDARLFQLARRHAEKGTSFVVLIRDADQVSTDALRRLGHLAKASGWGLRLALVVELDSGREVDTLTSLAAMTGPETVRFDLLGRRHPKAVARPEPRAEEGTSQSDPSGQVMNDTAPAAPPAVQPHSRKPAGLERGSARKSRGKRGVGRDSVRRAPKPQAPRPQAARRSWTSALAAGALLSVLLLGIHGVSEGLPELGRLLGVAEHFANAAAPVGAMGSRNLPVGSAPANEAFAPGLDTGDARIAEAGAAASQESEAHELAAVPQAESEESTLLEASEQAVFPSPRDVRGSEELAGVEATPRPPEEAPNAVVVASRRVTPAREARDPVPAVPAEGRVLATPPAAPAPTPAILPTPRGRVSINASPWARIRIDGKEVGVTPIGDLEVPRGTHRVRAILPDGRELERRVRVGANGVHLAFR